MSNDRLIKKLESKASKLVVFLEHEDIIGVSLKWSNADGERGECGICDDIPIDLLRTAARLERRWLMSKAEALRRNAGINVEQKGRNHDEKRDA